MIRAANGHQLDLFEDVVVREDWVTQLAAASDAATLPAKQVVGLFAGIGGFELGLSRAGHETLLLCENDSGANAVLDANFPAIRRHGDVRTLTHLPGDTDLIVAGFPCQDLSQAGKTAGITGKNSSLIGAVFELLRRRAVPWLLLENVPFMLQLGNGRALAVIVDELESLRYRWAYRIVDSRAFGLPQRRERVYLLASLEGDPREVLFADDAGPPRDRDFELQPACGFYWTEGIRGLGWAVDAVPTLKGGSTVGIPSPPAILMPSGEIVKPDIRDAERMQGFAPGWTKPAEIVVKPGCRWKLVGNAVTVDVAHWLGYRLRRPGSHEVARDHPLVPSKSWPKAAWGSDGDRASVAISSWPVRAKGVPLHRFLQFTGTLLSVKATGGFLSRAKSSRLRFPVGFLDAVEVHLKRMKTHDSHLWEEEIPWLGAGSGDLGPASADSASANEAGDPGSPRAMSAGGALQGPE
jgi:DNA (cytosine-5)-methyltransferase 1